MACSETSDSSGQATLDFLEGTEGPWAIRVYYDNQKQLAELTSEHAPWEVDRQQGFVITEFSDRAEIEVLQLAGFRTELDTALTSKLHAMPAIPDDISVAGIPSYPCYRTVEETYATASGLATDHPNLATWTDIGDSWDKTTGNGGYDIMVLRLTNQEVPGPKPIFFSMSAVHAREYTTAELMTRFAEHLVNGYGTDPEATWILDHHEIHLVLQANPDGRKEAEGGRMWRKNTNQAFCGPTSSSRGADLNRNYPFRWGPGGSSGSECSSTYRGPSPASEPETQAIIDYVRSIFLDQRDESLGDDAAAPADATGLFFDVHSYSELVLWPWGFSNEETGNGPAFRTLGRKFAFFNDYEPIQAAELYPTTGTTDDFAYGELGLAAYTFELGTWFFESCANFESRIYPDNLDALVYAAKVSRAPYMLPSGPDTLSVTFEEASVAQGALAQLSAVANDNRFSTANGSEQTQNIAAAQVYVDTPPWVSGATPVSLNAQDGRFDAKVETVTGGLPTVGLTEGRHLVFVRSQDADGHWGPVTSGFLTVLPANGNQPPVVTITGPANGASLAEGTPVGLTATASDPEDGNLDGAIEWSSDVDGPLGTGGSLTVNLSVGIHVLTASVQDRQNAGASIDISVTITPAGSVLLAESFDRGAEGWTTEGLWHLESNTSCASPGYSSAPNAMYYGRSTRCDYNEGGTTRGNLDSPAISGIGPNTVLRFSYFREVESYQGDYDFTTVEIVSGGSATTVWSRNARNPSQSAWLDSGDISLANYAGQSIQVRFRFDSRDGAANRFTGWLIDDVVVTD